MPEVDVFEQPLNERYRLFLRMEQLFQRIEHHLCNDDPWDTHAALVAVLELMQTIARGDSRQEIIRELERQRSALARFSHASAVDRDRLTRVVREQEHRLEALHAQQGTLGQELRAHELLNQLHQRAGPGGRPGTLELPSYQEWLQRPASERHDAVRQWLEPVRPASTAVSQCLALTRESAEWQRIDSSEGFFEQILPQAQDLQMLRMRMAQQRPGIYPEISAGRQRFSIRFFRQRSPAERATQVHEPITFDLACCGV